MGHDRQKQPPDGERAALRGVFERLLAVTALGPRGEVPDKEQARWRKGGGARQVR